MATASKCINSRTRNGEGIQLVIPLIFAPTHNVRNQEGDLSYLHPYTHSCGTLSQQMRPNYSLSPASQRRPRTRVTQAPLSSMQITPPLENFYSTFSFNSKSQSFELRALSAILTWDSQNVLASRDYYSSVQCFLLDHVVLLP